MNQSPDTQARTLVALLAVASAAVVVFSVMKLGGNPPLGPFLAFLTGAVLFECASTQLPGYGYVPLAFFVYLAAIARPSTLYPGGRLPGGGDALAIVSQAILMAVFAMTVAWIFRVFVLQDRLSFWHRASDFSINLLRVATIGILYLHLPGMQVNRDGVVTLDSFSWVNLWGFILAVALFWVFDRLLSRTAVVLLSGEAAQHLWLKVHSQNGLLVASVLVLSAFVTVWVAVAGEVSHGGSPVMATLLGLVAGAVPVLVMNRAVGESARAVDEEELELLENKLRAQKLQIETLKHSEERLSDEVHKQQGDLKMLDDMARDLGAATNLKDIFAIVLRVIRRMDIPFQSCVLFALNDGKPEAAEWDTPHEKVLSMAPLLQLEEEHVRKAAHSGWTELAADIRTSGEQRIFKDERSVLCVPLIVSKEPIGVLYLGAREAGTYTDVMKETLIKVAAHAAPSIHTARLLRDKETDLAKERDRREQEEAKNRLLNGLQQMVVEIGKNLKIEHSLDVVVKSVKDLVPQAQSVVLLLAEGGEDDVPEDGRSYKPAMIVSPYERVLEQEEIRPGHGLVGQALLHKSMIPVDDTREYSHPNLVQKELSAIAAPLVSEDEILGCLYVGAAKENEFDEEALQLIRTIASQASMAIKNARLMSRLQQLSFTDGLTGLYSHRYFKEQLKLEVEWAKRSGKPMALVLVDTDKFKQYNDTLGHPAGDALLQDIADILKGHVRSTDIVCRQGGDEFALIMKESPKEKAVETAEKIRESFMLRFSSHKVQVTSSIGVACFPTDATTLEDLAEVGDQALYTSKKTGRNKVSVAPSLDEKVSTPVGS